MNFTYQSLKSFQKIGLSAPNLVLIISEAQLKQKGGLGAWVSRSLNERILKAMPRWSEPVKAGGIRLIQGINKDEADIFLAVLPEKMTSFGLLNYARNVLKEAVPKTLKKLGIAMLNSEAEETLAEIFGAAISARIFQLPEYGKRLEKRKPFQLTEVQLALSKNKIASAEYGFETGEGGNLVRYLGSLPPNELDSGSYAKRIRQIASEYKFQYKFHSNAELKKMGAGAFTAVDRGDPESEGGIHELTYSPAKPKNKQAVAMVGKGLCFDTGGYDIKTGGNMLTMKGDMQGSAVALSTMMTASRLKWPLKMKAFLGVTENHISPRAYKADEVVTALNGVSIEVINTDAEGRMVLADTLALASRTKPEMIVDFATLTGCSMIAIGKSYAAGFTNRDDLHIQVVDAGKKSGERVWTFPLDEDYGKALESPIADFLQCAHGRSPDHILAAYFLMQFVEKEIDWVHIDLAGPADKEGGLAHVDTFYTGFGVRWALEFLKSKYRV